PTYGYWFYCSSKESPASRSINWASQRVLCWLLLRSFSYSSRTDENPNRDEVGNLGTLAHVTRGSVAKTSLFLEQLLFGGDNGGDRLIGACSGLGWLGRNR